MIYIALYAASFESVERSFVKKAGKWELQVSISKTKGMVVGEELQDSDKLPVRRRVDFWRW